MKLPTLPRRLSTTALVAALAINTLAISSAARGQSTIVDASMASGMSAAVPLAVVGVSGAAALSAATLLTVKSVEVSTSATSVVLEGVINGVSKTVTFTVDAATGFAVGAGTVLSTASVAGGVILYEGSHAVALIPNPLGQQLMHHEQLTHQ